MNLHSLQYPIGELSLPLDINSKLIQDSIKEIAEFPSRLSQLVSSLSEKDLEKTYRPDGWTIRQVVHHCADSHMNSFIRFKLAMTEDNPKIKPYMEASWAELIDTKNYDISPSLKLIEALHQRWVVLLNSLTELELNKTFTHPEHGKIISLKEAILIYAWHGNHHLAHIKLALNS